MRYPEDLYKVQRNVLADYHVTNPKTFYEGSDKWEVPEDPEAAGRKQPPYRLSVTTRTARQPVFSLTWVYVPTNRQNLASFMAVGADASDASTYGKIRILRLPDNTQVPGPSQIANQFNSDDAIATRLRSFTQSNARVRYGNLLTLPVGGGLLYVQPLYTLRNGGEGRYPQLQFVLVSFGEEVGIGSTLNEALDDVLGTTTTPATARAPVRARAAPRPAPGRLRRRPRAAAAGQRQVRRRRPGAQGRRPRGLRQERRRGPVPGRPRHRPLRQGARPHQSPSSSPSVFTVTACVAHRLTPDRRQGRPAPHIGGGGRAPAAKRRNLVRHRAAARVRVKSSRDRRDPVLH